MTTDDVWTLEFVGTPGRDPYSNNARVIGPPVICHGVSEPDEPVEVVPASALDDLRAENERLAATVGHYESYIEHREQCECGRVAVQVEFPDGTMHDPRCNGDCPVCRGADACSMVGGSCGTCAGECVKPHRDLAAEVVERGRLIEHVRADLDVAVRERDEARAERDQLREALDAADWLIRCLDDVRRKVPVRCLDEANSAYCRARAALAVPAPPTTTEKTDE